MDIQKARNFWQKKDTYLFDFAVEIADGEDADIGEMATQFRQTASLFYGYRIGGKCWLKFRDAYGDDAADKYRDLLPISFWVAIGRKVEAEIFDMEDVMDWFKQALDEGWSVDKFRNELHQTTGYDFDFLKEARRVERRYFQFPAIGATQEQVGRIVKAAHELHSALLAVLGA